jgi:hypothetical protein
VTISLRRTSVETFSGLGLHRPHLSYAPARNRDTSRVGDLAAPRVHTRRTCGPAYGSTTVASDGIRIAWVRGILHRNQRAHDERHVAATEGRLALIRVVEAALTLLG